MTIGTYIAETGGERYEVSIDPRSRGYLVRSGDGAEGRRIEIEERGGVLHVVLDGKAIRVGYARGRRGHVLVRDGHVHEVRVRSAVLERYQAMLPEGGAAGGRLAVEAPIPGLVTEVRVTEGQRVTAGETLVVLYAMKLENEIPAPEDGVVRAVHASAQAAVEKGDALVELET
jgi:acetyl-CoA/propionyl-CoA carboxylase biotin carboxyl carrier protein